MPANKRTTSSIKSDSLSIHKLVSMQAAEQPDKIAVRHNGQTITYRELDDSSNQIAAYLLKSNIGRDDIIAVVLDRSIKLVACLLGIIKAGAAYLPIDPELPPDRVNFMIKDCVVKTLCVSAYYAGQYDNYSDKIIFDDVWLKRHEFPLGITFPDPGDHQLTYILYTSGSTGTPKGVAVEHGNLLNLLLSIQKSPGISSGDVMLGITTISFDIAELEIFLPLIAGAQLVIVDKDVAKDGRALLNIIKTEHISIVQATPFTWRMILQSGWHDPLPIRAFCGGEAMSKDLAHKLLEKCGELWNMYGPTETTIYSLIKKISADDEVITIGKPVNNTRVYILDNDGKPVPEGQEGELYIGGDGVSKGYICRQELDAERFISDRFSGQPGKRIYKTGDLCKILPNGEVQYMGRIDQQIKIRGYRIEPEEIEYQLKILKGVKDALVVLHEDKLGSKQLIAYIVTKKFFTVYHRNKRIIAWKKHLKSTLPAYMLPNYFVVINHIPLMPNGKVDRKMLPQPAPRRIPRGNQMPQTATEIILANIIIKNTGFKDLSVNENFIDLGIDSLVALVIIVDIEEKFDKRLPLTVLAHHPTVKLLAKFIDNVSASPYNSLIPLKKQGSKLPLYLIHGIGLNLFHFNDLLNSLDDEQPVYGLRAAGLDGNHKPLESIEEIAAYYNQEIFNHDPIGPYAIAGYSLGGIIAYEMARQLKQAGKNVVMLAMFDTNLQTDTKNSTLTDNVTRKINRQYEKIKFRFDSFLKDPLLNMVYLKDIYQQRLKELLIVLGLADKNKPAEFPIYMQNVMDKLEEAWHKYVITPADLKIDLFKAKKRIYYIDDPQYLGWQKFAQGGITIYPVPGDHKEMFFPPNVKVLAETLQNRLDEIQINKLTV